MSEKKSADTDAILKNLQDLPQKIEKLTFIFEKFGMDVITKLGNVSFNIKKLADTVKELDKATLDIKSLIPQLNNIIENQKSLEREIHLLRSLTYRNLNKNTIIENKSTTNTHQEEKSTKNQLITSINLFRTKLDNTKDYKVIIEDLSNLKEEIFEFTGGNKILYEISQIIKKIKNEQKLTDPIKEIIIAKLDFWLKKMAN